MSKTLIDLLLAQQDSRASIYVRTATDQVASLSYHSLLTNACKRLTDLQSLGLKRGDTCILYLYDELAFFETFWACILGGIIPVPVAPGNTPEHKNKLLLVARDLCHPFIVTEATAMRRFEDHFSDQSNENPDFWSRLIYYEPLSSKTPMADIKDMNAQDIAYIQFSSGSTRAPKGVVLTHENLVANIQDLCFAFGLTFDAKTLSWMPLTHDMGLIGFHLCPLAAGIDQHLMRTALFIRRPLSWLEIAAEVGATTLGSPNFGYRHWLQAHEKTDAPLPDLSKIRQIINGAEPISLKLTTQFMDALKPSGLDQGVMCPSYGLAEASLGIAVAQPGLGARAVWVNRTEMQFGQPVPYVCSTHVDAASFAIEGQIFANSQVRIGTHDGIDLGEHILGEIQICGKNVTAGYHNQPDANAALFTHDGWLRTSDLGFFYNGELVVAGRLKDMIVNNGQNYFAHDIELMIEEAGLAEIGEVAAGVVERQNIETFAVFLRDRSPDSGFAQRADRVRQHIYRTCGLALAEIVPVRSIPKTTSGKICRSALAKELNLGGFNEQLKAVFDPNPLKQKEVA